MDKNGKSMVVVYGPPGCGKTINGEKLKTLFGKKRIIDDVDFYGLELEKPTTDDLVLCNDPKRLKLNKLPFLVSEISYEKAISLAS